MLLYPSAVDLSKFEKNKLKKSVSMACLKKWYFVKIALTAIKNPIRIKNINIHGRVKNLLFYLTKKVFVQHAELRRKNVS